jgi:hypothetical protein
MGSTLTPTCLRFLILFKGAGTAPISGGVALLELHGIRQSFNTQRERVAALRPVRPSRHRDGAHAS